MLLRALKSFLDDHRVHYLSIGHSPAYTAAEIADRAHIAHRMLAKTVMVKVDGHLAMAVVPATDAVDLDRLRIHSGAKHVELAHEYEFATKFSDCEVGAMPPFGNLYGLPVYLSTKLAAEQELAFNAGNHHEIIKLSTTDYLRLVAPRILEF